MGSPKGTFLLAAALTAAGLVACSDNHVDDVDVKASSVSVKAADFDSRPPTGERRKTPDGGTDVDVQAQSTSQAQSPAAAAAEDELFAFTNRDRLTAGTAPAGRDPSLDAYARDHAALMAGQDRLHHSAINGLLNAWWTIGENVGVGPDTSKIQAAFQKSPSHFQNLTNPVFTSLGVGVAIDANGRVWTALDFAA